MRFWKVRTRKGFAAILGSFVFKICITRFFKVQDNTSTAFVIFFHLVVNMDFFTYLRYVSAVV